MQDILNFLATNNGAALVIALLIFLVTLVLVVKRLIGFVITIVLLIFAIVSGFFVANADLFRDVLKGMTANSTPEERQTVEQLKAQFQKAYEELKSDLKTQKEEFQKIIQKSKAKDEPPVPVEPQPVEPTPPPPSEKL